jgi:hypothetical protein
MGDELDSILDSALDDFDADESAPPPTAAPTSSSSSATSQPLSSDTLPPGFPFPPGVDLPTPSPEELKQGLDELKRFLWSMPNSPLGEEIQKQLGVDDENLRQLAKEAFDAISASTSDSGETTTGGGGTTTGPTPAINTPATTTTTTTAPTTSRPPPLSPPSERKTDTKGDTKTENKTDNKTDNKSDFNTSIDEALKMLAESPMNEGGAPGDMDKVFEKMFGQMGDVDKAGLDKMMESIMGQMLSKDYLYQPMKDIADKYPKWLEENESKLYTKEVEMYKKQQDCFQRICHVFESTPNDTQKVTMLMQEMQNYGKPPDSLVAGILPPGMDGFDGGGAGFDEDAFMKQIMKGGGPPGGPGGVPPGCPTQ